MLQLELMIAVTRKLESDAVHRISNHRTPCLTPHCYREGDVIDSLRKWIIGTAIEDIWYLSGSEIIAWNWNHLAFTPRQYQQLTF